MKIIKKKYTGDKKKAYKEQIESGIVEEIPKPPRKDRETRHKEALEKIKR
jgi:hypothetical protein